MINNKKPVLGMILKGYPRVSETFISNEILLLEKMGFNIHIFSMRHPRESFCHESVKQIKARVDYLPSTISGNLRPLLFHNLLLAIKKPLTYSGAVKIGIRRFLRTKKSATIKHLLQAGYMVHHLMPKSGVTHLHAHFAHSPTSVAMFASRLSGLKFSFTGHAKDIYTSNPKQLKEKIELADFVVTCTEYNRNFLSGFTNGQKNIHRVYHGIDLGLFSGGRDDAHPDQPFQIFTVARLTEKKGLPTVYKALKVLQGRGIKFNHTLIGDGDDKDKILALIKDLGLDDCSQWLGTQPHDVVIDQFRKSDLFVLGCEVAVNGDRDGIPNVLVESMAMGVPVVATDVSAIPELVNTENTGLLVSPGNPEALADSMLRLLTDSELRSKVIYQARERVEQGFDNTALIGDLAQIYKTAGF